MGLVRLCFMAHQSATRVNPTGYLDLAGPLAMNARWSIKDKHRLTLHETSRSGEARSCQET